MSKVQHVKLFPNPNKGIPQIGDEIRARLNGERRKFCCTILSITGVRYTDRAKLEITYEVKVTDEETGLRAVK